MNPLSQQPGEDCCPVRAHWGLIDYIIYDLLFVHSRCTVKFYRTTGALQSILACLSLSANLSREPANCAVLHFHARKMQMILKNGTLVGYSMPETDTPAGLLSPAGEALVESSNQ
jgi:hypothetical protein